MRTDIVLKTTFHDDTVEKIHAIRNDPDIKVELEDDEIREMLEAELTNLVKSDSIVTYTYDGRNVEMSNAQYSELMAMRIVEYKRDEEIKMKEKKLQDEIISKLPRELGEREMDKIDLATFLKCVEVTLNSHPLYRFYSFNTTDIQGSNKYYATLVSNRDVHDRVGTLQFAFTDKLKRVLQSRTATFDPIVGLRNVILDREIRLDHSNSIMASIECSVISHSIMGTTLRKVIKSIYLTRLKQNRVLYTNHFPFIEFHECKRQTPTATIRIRILDSDGSEIRFKNGDVALTLRCERKSRWES